MSPARARRKAAKRARRKPAARPKRTTTKRTTARAPARRTSGSAARRKTASKTSKPRLGVVRPARPKRPPAPPRPAFPQRAGASPKQLILFEMIRARAALLAAIQGLTPASANQPMGEGKWSARETVLHLVTRDQARLRESESTLRGQQASWKDVHDPEMGAINAELMAPLRALDWEEAVRLLHRTRELLMEELESVPEEPAEVWGPDHPFGGMLHALPTHDRHHAEVLKRWRAQQGA